MSGTSRRKEAKVGYTAYVRYRMLRRSRFPSYLRTHRRTWGLTQKELAFLLSRSSASISSYERLDTHPGLEDALAYEVLFDTPVGELMPAVNVKVEARVRRRVERLLIQLKGKRDSRSVRVRELLRAAVGRLAG